MKTELSEPYLCPQSKQEQDRKSSVYKNMKYSIDLKTSAIIRI